MAILTNNLVTAGRPAKGPTATEPSHFRGRMPLNYWAIRNIAYEHATGKTSVNIGGWFDRDDRLDQGDVARGALVIVLDGSHTQASAYATILGQDEWQGATSDE